MARPARPPAPVAPMLATPGPVPEDQDRRWSYEMKWDGARAVVTVADRAMKIYTRNGNEVSASYPDLATVVAALDGRPAMLDGEIIACDARGVPDFGLLQRRLHVRAPGRQLLAAVPVRLYLFDLLNLDGHNLMPEPYERRRELLEGLELRADALAVPPRFTGPGADVLDTARQAGLEGVVAKRVDSAYRPGQRSRAWIKTPLFTTQEVIIGGWTPGQGRRSGTIGALLLGVHDNAGTLRYVGDVGTGFSEATLRQLGRLLDPLARQTSPFDTPVPSDRSRNARWVTPRVVGEVTYRTLTAEGRLRHASWRGIRADREPEEIAGPRAGATGPES